MCTRIFYIGCWWKGSFPSFHPKVVAFLFVKLHFSEIKKNRGSSFLIQSNDLCPLIGNWEQCYSKYLHLLLLLSLLLLFLFSSFSFLSCLTSKVNSFLWPRRWIFFLQSKGFIIVCSGELLQSIFHHGEFLSFPHLWQIYWVSSLGCQLLSFRTWNSSFQAFLPFKVSVKL